MIKTNILSSTHYSLPLNVADSPEHIVPYCLNLALFPEQYCFLWLNPAYYPEHVPPGNCS